ncbi:uncharacterized protein LOC120005955 [Tripterygium wilfordii]|uniref:uncharacterized protein LOC120005955 n=1 Tax=Tripterygium wilfordii TaxID=458696 RepID=UPI0018F83B88|nr:uncharacterized protein LOC120005955 [Tripterygium wilfordii]
MLTEWMFTNNSFDDARQLTYTEFPSFWRWDSTNKYWFRRKRVECIGRISYVHPSAGDVYYLRILLSHIKGPTNFIDVRTVNGKVYNTFKDACNAMGLIGNDKEWHEAMKEAANWATSKQLRNLFVTMILFCEVVDANDLFQASVQNLGEDVVYQLRQKLGMSTINISETETTNRVLVELQTLLKRNGSSLNEPGLPEPQTAQIQEMANTMLNEELSHNTEELRNKSITYLGTMNVGQKNVYNAVLEAVYKQQGGLFFIYGHGGTGKTFVYNAIIAKLRSEGKIVLAVASSGIASLLLPGGRTAHSRFKIPIDINDESTCHIKKGTQLAELLQKTSLIVWDEAPMAHRFCFEALDRSLEDLFINIEDTTQYPPFGGKCVLLGGDFRQILPVVVKGSRHDTIKACLTNSYLWKQCRVFTLTENMRLSMVGLSNYDNIQLAKFADWLLQIGDGTAEAIKMKDDEESPTWIRIPDNLLVQSINGDVEDIVSAVYPDFLSSYSDPNFLKERAIIIGTNEAVDLINSCVLEMIPSEQKTYLSFDSIYRVAGASDDDDLLYPPEFLNSLTFNGLPNNELKLKLNTPVML